MASKIKLSRNRKASPTELTWEEKNPIDYLHFYSKDVERLRQLIERNKNSSSMSTKQKREKD